MVIHGPSLALGAGIACAAIIVSFFAFNFMSTSEIELQPVNIPPTEPTNIEETVFTGNGSPLLGNPEAEVTLIEFGDYQCHFCNRFFHDTEEQVMKNYIETGKVKMIFKDFTIIGPDSVNAAHGAHCANDQGKFWEYHDILYNHWTGENNGWAASENLLGFAEEIKLDVEEWSDCMISGKYRDVIAASNSDAKTLGLTGTPGFFIIGPDNHITQISGARPYEVFAEIFDLELAK